MRRPSLSADLAVMLPRLPGSRLLDRRPPHNRCPAVPGLKTPARAILTVPGSSVLPSAICHCRTCPVRAPEADAFTGVLLTCFAAARQFIPPGPTVSLATRETIPVPPPNVYSGRHRFLNLRREGNLWRIPWVGGSIGDEGPKPGGPAAGASSAADRIPVGTGSRDSGGPYLLRAR